ncbi:MAG: hypothetical protein LBP85_02340 [Prevotellaceae bacterium]|jgi:hypothetical protein|nr:hypothetical protein [Prevotellaceae bacterium]
MKRTEKIMAIIAMSATVFASYDKNDEKPQSSLGQEYFTVQDATLQRGEIPRQSTGDAFSGITINSKVLPGGSSFVSLRSEEQISEIYVSVENVSKYYRLPVVASGTSTQASNNHSARATHNTFNTTKFIADDENKNHK